MKAISLSAAMCNKSLEIMLSAIEIYNKPTFIYRDETFAILAINAWELILKAKILADNDDKIESIYIPSAKAGQYKSNRCGAPMTLDINGAIKTLNRNTMVVPKQVETNIGALIEIRDNAIHFISDSVSHSVYQIAAASVKNFLSIAHEWFKKDWKDRNLYLLPLGFLDFSQAQTKPIEVSVLGQIEKYLNDLVAEDNHETTASKKSGGYNVGINIKIAFVKSVSAEADTAVRITNDPSAPAVRISDAQMKQTYPFTYRQLTDKLRDKYPGFLENNRYHKARKPLQIDKKFADTRLLDPDNPRSSRQTFYSPNIMGEIAKKLGLT